MIPVLRMFEVVVATAFYSGICYMIFEGTGELSDAAWPHESYSPTLSTVRSETGARHLTLGSWACSTAILKDGDWRVHVPSADP